MGVGRRKAVSSIHSVASCTRIFTSWNGHYRVQRRTVAFLSVTQPKNLRQSFNLPAPVRVGFLFAGKRIHGGLDGLSALANIPTIATCVDRAETNHKIVGRRGQIGHAHNMGRSEQHFHAINSASSPDWDEGGRAGRILRQARGRATLLRLAVLDGVQKYFVRMASGRGPSSSERGLAPGKRGAGASAPTGPSA